MVADKNHGHHVCPWYMAYTFDNPLRKLVHDPAKILGPYVKPGMTVVDIGCGMGFFSMGMARLVGPAGKVLSLDLQPQMLGILEKRARRKGLLEQIETRVVGDGLGLTEPVNFALCFWMLHEVPDQAVFLKEVHDSIRPGGYLFIAEPSTVGHVTMEQFEDSVQLAIEAGFEERARPKVRMSRAGVFEKL